ncbi:MAG: potassium-transporting ATPase subunit KdpA [Acidobacteriota bacterium]|nr:potassium-transporting ATPase subunit KdpA [Acidobacteriota bacterium]
MTANGWLQFVVFSLLILITARPLGIYLEGVIEGKIGWINRLFGKPEQLIYKLCGVQAHEEMGWKEYAGALLGFSAVTLLATYFIERLQAILPFNPQHLTSVSPWLAWNTSASFTTNTNWQSYTPEMTMSYLTQMAGLATHNFLSAAVGIVAAIALVRGIKRTDCKTIGNFWVDITRVLLYVLLPGSVIYALVLVATGVPQNLHGYVQAHTLEQPGIVQTIAEGPVASQEAIKMLGTNGGGFFNANSAHPYENPTPFSNFLEILSIFLIPAALTCTLGSMTHSPGHGWAVFAAMFVLFAAGFAAVYAAESQYNPMLRGVAQTGSATAPAGNMEGKEVRNGIAASALFATATTDASCGAVNSMHDSYTPLGGMVLLTNILLGEVVFGGVGAGLYGMLIFVILAVFIAGLMVGRTPEYLGKKIEAFDVKMAMLYVLIFPLAILTLAAIYVILPKIGLSSLNNPGPHGLSEILYAFTSAVGNNGSAFAGLNANTPAYNIALGWAMLIGRFLMLVPVLAIAGNLAQKKRLPVSAGTFPVNTPTFTVLLIGVVLILGALTFFPVLSLGPILEHLQLHAGHLF